jgi:hypothetical protein
MSAGQVFYASLTPGERDFSWTPVSARSVPGWLDEVKNERASRETLIRWARRRLCAQSRSQGTDELSGRSLSGRLNGAPT